jgi:hypothetical protein
MAGADTDKLGSVTAILEYLATHGEAFDFRDRGKNGDAGRHVIYRLSQRQDNPLPVDGPPNMPVASKAKIDRWVELCRKRSNRTPLAMQLGLFGDSD